MAGVYGPSGRVGRPKSGYPRSARRVDARHQNARAREFRGPQRVITISTWENSPEWRWFQAMDQAKGRTRSKRARESLRAMLEDVAANRTVEGLAKALTARTLEIECRDAEIIHLRHALGLHWSNPHPDCEACSTGNEGGGPQ